MPRDSRGPEERQAVPKTRAMRCVRACDYMWCRFKVFMRSLFTLALHALHFILVGKNKICSRKEMTNPWGHAIHK
jgi:hypothetical protein